MYKGNIPYIKTIKTNLNKEEDVNNNKEKEENNKKEEEVTLTLNFMNIHGKNFEISSLEIIPAQ